MHNKDKQIETLQKKINKLEATLKIVTRHSGKTESRMREQFEVISKTIPVPMMISNEAGEIYFANLNAQKTYGYSVDEFSKINDSSLYHILGDRDAFVKTLKEKGDVEGFRTDHKKNDGSIFPAVLFSQRIDFDGQSSHLTIVHDLTEVMALEKQLRQAHKLEAIGTLASGIAHDFNNILAAIFGYTELMKHLMDSETDQKKIEYLDKVQKAANRAKSMIMQMMAFCRQPEKDKKPFYISAIIDEVVKMMNELSPSNIDIRWDIQSDIENKQIMVTGDSTQIHQVVTNLITNSVQALSAKGGIIDVLLEKRDIVSDSIREQRGEVLIPRLQPGRYARITVRDNGPGINENIIQDIFDPFFTTKAVGQGSGMGLAVVHGIIRGHNGSVSVESKLGQGATFHCYFLVTEKVDDTTERVAEFKTIKKGDEQILLIDDEPMVLDMCNETLLTMGYRVTPCERSREALTIVKRNPEAFDLVITDNTMPEMSGIELSDEILSVRPDIPIIVITGDLVNNVSDFKKTGIRAYIQKPFDQREIQTVIRGVL